MHQGPCGYLRTLPQLLSPWTLPCRAAALSLQQLVRTLDFASCRACCQVAELLGGARDPAAILCTLPQLLDPRTLISVIVTLQRWYPKREPLDVLQARRPA